VTVLTLARPDKRNAFSDEVVLGLSAFFSAIPGAVRGIVVHGAGAHFCAGLDLNELREGTAADGIVTSVIGQRLNDLVQYARVPVIAVLHGAVIGAGLEFAAAAHLRVAERSAYYALPEGQRGIFVGSGGSVRLPRLIGTATVMDMMLTGRRYSAEEGAAMRLSQYLVEPGEGLAKALELAMRIAANAPLANFAILQALPRIAESDPMQGLFTETLMVSIAQGDDEAKRRLRDFLEKRAHKVERE
jgi:enoyl-CoA hydratase/carnithine racemase